MPIQHEHLPSSPDSDRGKSARPARKGKPSSSTLSEGSKRLIQVKVFIVTGSSSGFGKELAKILYQRNAKVYIAVRSESKARAAMDELKTLYPDSKGQLVYLHLDLADLASIKASALDFISREMRLDVLWNNAGVMLPPEGSKTVQGFELQLGVNVLGTLLFTLWLRPILAATAAKSPANSVRVVWVSSIAAKHAPKPPIDLSNLLHEKFDESQRTKYGRCKAGMILVAAEFGNRVASDGIVSIVRSLYPFVQLSERLLLKSSRRVSSQA